QRIAGHVHALPEGGDAEQDAASACGELVQQACPPCLPLYEERPATAGAALAQRGRNVTQRAIRREQREQSAVARARHVLDHRADHFIEACTLVAAGDRQVRGDGQQRLLLKIERRLVGGLANTQPCAETEALAHEAEAGPRRER